jgi:hypothetical protein
MRNALQALIAADPYQRPTRAYPHLLVGLRADADPAVKALLADPAMDPAADNLDKED